MSAVSHLSSTATSNTCLAAALTAVGIPLAERPFVHVVGDVMLRTGNPLVKGETPEEGTPEFTSSIMGFVYAHCAPWPEVVRASFNEQAFREAALIFCGALTPADFQTAFKRLEEQLKELEAAQVEPVAGLGGKKPRRATNPVF